MTPDAAELHRQARALLRPDVYDYYAGGSGREATLRANEKAWRRVRLRPRIFRDVSAVDTSVDMAGWAGGRLRTPLAVAPTAFHRLAHPDGEIATAIGAARAGALYVMSTRSSCRIEDVAGASAGAGGTWWFQVYLMRDRELTAGLVRRAAAAGAQALVLTADTPVVGRKGRSKGRSKGDDLMSEADFLVNLGQLADLNAAELASDVSFTDINWLTEISGGLPVVAKGVLRPDDAEACLAHGAAGVIVSNHGGRQLDGAVPTAWALPGVAATVRGAWAGRESVDGAVPFDGAVPVGGAVSVDGGVRSAEDALAALALGARFVFLGRPVLWALACGGADGVQALLDGLTDDLAHVMALAGAACLADLAGLAEPAFPAGSGSRAVPSLPDAHPRHNVES
ncbi:MAG: 4-hydroxymandelate oxidase [Streptosporangiaceae bacterium]|nr:4-hydroxymandelate oxidase [Streptosporangiaceae bacterium]